MSGKTVSFHGLRPDSEGVKSLLKGMRKRDFLSVLIISIFGLIAIFILDRYNFLLAHIFIELFSVAVAWTIFFIVWNGRHYFENDFFIVLGVVYLFVGIVDTTHTIAYKGMNIFRDTGTDIPTQLWILARYMEAAASSIAPLFLFRKVGHKITVTIVTLFTAISMTAIFTGYFPTCHIEGVGLTPFKIISEYVVSGLLLVAAWNILRNRESFRLDVLVYLIASIGTTILAEMLFTFYIGVYDLSNVLGHYFKFISFYLLYKGVIVNGVREPYSILAKRLEDRTVELEESREELRSTQRITSTMLDNLPEEISLIDLDTFRIIDANKTFIDFYGGSKDKVVGKTCYEVTHGFEEPCNSPEHPCPIKMNLQFGTPVTHVHRGAGGEDRYYEITVWELRDKRSGTSTKQAVHIARDITDRVRAQQLREDVERIVQHDLKSPLNGIIGGSQMLSGSDRLSEEERSIISSINEAGERVLNMVNRSLDMYKMAEGTYELDANPFNLRKLLGRVAGAFPRILNAKELSLSIDIGGKELENADDLNIVAEEQTVETMLSNLVQNAIEASPKGKEVSVHVRRDGENVDFDIHNYGVIPESVRDRFFERYITFGKRHGTGLGTYSAWLIARAHGGTIRFTTDEEEGTHLLVRLPAGR